MKLLSFINKPNTLRNSCILITLLASMTSTYAQNAKVVFNGEPTTVNNVIEAIQTQTNYVFAFDKKTFDISRNISIDAGSYDIGEVLQLLTTGTGSSCIITDDYIVINSAERPEPDSVSETAISQRTSDRYRPGVSEGRDKIQLIRPSAPPQPEVAAQPEPHIEQTPAYSAYSDPDIYHSIAPHIPRFNIKTNLLYGAATLTPNLSMEIGLSSKTSFEITGIWNQWHRVGTLDDNKKLNHFIIRPEYRWWTCERYSGHFFGAHAFFSKYNISQHKVPMLFDKEYRYQGYAVGIGVTYGYHLPLAKKWGMEFNLGLGAAQLKYKRYDCVLCSDEIDKPSKTYFGPTRAAVSLVFMIK